jgi:hypothetical protein
MFLNGSPAPPLNIGPLKSRHIRRSHNGRCQRCTSIKPLSTWRPISKRKSRSRHRECPSSSLGLLNDGRQLARAHALSECRLGPMRSAISKRPRCLREAGAGVRILSLHEHFRKKTGATSRISPVSEAANGGTLSQPSAAATCSVAGSPRRFPARSAGPASLAAPIAAMAGRGPAPRRRGRRPEGRVAPKQQHRARAGHHHPMQIEPGAAHLRGDRAVGLHHREHRASGMRRRERSGAG